MTAPLHEAATRDQYLAEANAELDAMLGEVGELDSAPPREPQPHPTFLRLVVVAVIAVAVFAIGLLLLRGRRPGRMAIHMR